MPVRKQIKDFSLVQPLRTLVKQDSRSFIAVKELRFKNSTLCLWIQNHKHLTTVSIFTYTYLDIKDGSWVSNTEVKYLIH